MNYSADVQANWLSHRPRRAKIVLGVLIVFSGLAFLMVCSGAIGQFQSIFSSFGSDLPWLTNELIQHQWLWGATISAVFVMQLWLAIFGLYQRKLRYISLSFWLGVTNVIAFVITMIGMYLPIIQLGSPI